VVKCNSEIAFSFSHDNNYYTVGYLIRDRPTDGQTQTDDSVMTS